MDWIWLLFSFKGRIQRLYWWLANLAVTLVVAMVGSTIEIVARSQGMAS